MGGTTFLLVDVSLYDKKKHFLLVLVYTHLKMLKLRYVYLRS